MIKATELRIGNFIFPINSRVGIHLPEKTTLRILELKAFSISALRPYLNPAETLNWDELRYDELSPIPLSEEWLKKFGFEKEDSLARYSNTKYVREGIEVDPDMMKVVINKGEHSEGGVSLPHIEHVHQLQNLCFALTGEELTLKS